MAKKPAPKVVSEEAASSPPSIIIGKTVVVQLHGVMLKLVEGSVHISTPELIAMLDAGAIPYEAA